MNTVLVIAPHADDETLGCGGSVLRHLASGDQVHWLLLSSTITSPGDKPQRNLAREKVLEEVRLAYGFSGYHPLDLPAAHFDALPISELIQRIGAVIGKVRPHTMYVPFEGDTHTDHGVAFRASIACTKWFRFDSVKRVLAYETVSETEFSLNPTLTKFQPNVFVDITDFLKTKIEILKIYSEEISLHPFPRSEETIRALAKFRGSTAGVRAAEAFQLLKEIL